MNNKVHVKTGDEVIVINGKNRGMKGKVLQVSPAEGKVIVEGVNIVTKHVKPRKMGEPGGLIKAESALYASKVQLICRSAAARPGWPRDQQQGQEGAHLQEERLPRSV